MLIRRLAASVNLLEGLWAVFIWSTGLSGGKLGTLPLVIGALLVADSVLCFAGRWAGFPIGALLSLVAMVSFALQLGSIGTTELAVSLVLGVAALVLDAKAALARPPISEENHPLNLPVFG